MNSPTQLPTTSEYAGSMAYDQDDTGVSLYPIEGIHGQLEIERAIHWCHQELEEVYWKPIRIIRQSSDTPHIKQEE